MCLFILSFFRYNVIITKEGKPMTDNFKDSDFSPGYYLNRYLTENKINPADFAKTLDVDLDKINAVLNADAPLEKGVPEKLARAIGTSSALWRNLDKQYWGGEEK